MIKKIILSFLGLMMLPMGVQAQNTFTETQHTPFGEVQLISCTTALRTNGPMYLGIRVLPEKGWHTDTPNLTITTSDGTPATLFMPFKQPYHDGQIYPISAQLTYKPTQPITFNASGFIHACNNNQCQTQSINLATTLQPKMALLTPECTGITLALSNVPIPMYLNKLKAFAYRDKEGIPRLIVDLEKHPRTLMLYDNNKNPLNIETEVIDKRAIFTLPNNIVQNSTSPENLESIHVFIRTHRHYYEIKTNIMPAGTSIPSPPINTFEVIQACLLFFLLSAVPLYWGRVPLKSRPKFHKQTIQTLILMTIACPMFIAIIGLFQYYSPQNTFSFLLMPLPKSYALILMGLGLIFIPASPLFILLYLAVTPRPYLHFLTEIGNNWIQLLPLIAFAILTLFSFAIQLIFEKQIFKFMTSNHSSKIWWVVRLPWIALIIYIWFYL